MARNVNASGGGTIRFSNVNGTISLALGLPQFQANVRIYGPGPSNLFLNLPYGADGFTFSAGTTGILSGRRFGLPSQQLDGAGQSSMRQSVAQTDETS